MNYYPNYYMNNYPYNGNNSSQYIPQPQSYMPTTQPQPQPQGLNGKIVDSADVVRATEVPIGGYGIFPKADLSEIYIKSWNNNGTTSVITFKPVPQEAPVETVKENNSDAIMEILNKINVLENKIDSLNNSNSNINSQQQRPVLKKETRVNNEY